MLREGRPSCPASPWVSTRRAAIFPRVVNTHPSRLHRIAVLPLLAAALLVASWPAPGNAEGCVQLETDDPGLEQLGPKVVAVLERVLSRDARGLLRLATERFGQDTDEARLQNQLEVAVAQGHALTHLEELEVWRVEATENGAEVLCTPAPGPRVRVDTDTTALLALGEGPREGGPGRGRIALLLSGDGLALDYLHLTPASLGGGTSEAYLEAAERAKAEGAPELSRLLLDLALELAGAGPRVLLPVSQQVIEVAQGLGGELPRGTPVTWTNQGRSMRIYRLGTWPISPYRPGLVLEYHSEAARDPHAVAEEADWLVQELASRHPTLAGHFDTVVLAPRDEVIGPEGDPHQTTPVPQTVRAIAWPPGPGEPASP